MNATRRLIFWLALSAVAVAGLQAQEPKTPASSLVAHHRGQLPVVLSAPHGGTMDVPGATPRKGEGLARGGAGFAAVRDTNTEELAYALSAAIEKATGKKPYLIVAKFHRKYIDANRPPEIGVEDAKARPVYDAYRGQLAEYCREVKKTYGKGLLLDLHGQSSQKDTVIRGTQNGKTVRLLVSRYGEKAHTGPKSFFGLLAAHGFKVNPADGTGKEVAGLNGGNIVQTYGSEAYGLDAIQLEFGGDYRTKAAVEKTAAGVAAAVADFAKLYLTDKD